MSGSVPVYFPLQATLDGTQNNARLLTPAQIKQVDKVLAGEKPGIYKIDKQQLELIVESESSRPFYKILKTTTNGIWCHNKDLKNFDEIFLYSLLKSVTAESDIYRVVKILPNKTSINTENAKNEQAILEFLGKSLEPMVLFDEKAVILMNYQRGYDLLKLYEMRNAKKSKIQWSDLIYFDLVLYPNFID